MSQNSSRKLAREKKKRQQKRLQFILLIGGGLLLLAGILFAVFHNSKTVAATVEVAGSPSLKVDQEVVDLGNVTLGKVVEVTFQLTNVGDQSLRFSEAPYIEVIEGC
jgi:cell division septal protein FtsQ